MTRENVIAKVKKLLNMTTDNGASEGEMHAALANAQKLMAQFGLKEADLTLDNDEVHEVPFTFGTKSVSSMQAIMALMLSRHFGVELLLSTNRTTKEQTLKVIGEESKTLIFTETLKYTYSCYQQMWTRYHKKLDPMIPKSKIRGDYFEGFCKGVENALEVNETQNALVVVSSALVKQYMATHHQFTGAAKQCSVHTTNDASHRSAGYADGKASVSSKDKALT